MRCLTQSGKLKVLVGTGLGVSWRLLISVSLMEPWKATPLLPWSAVGQAARGMSTACLQSVRNTPLLGPCREPILGAAADRAHPPAVPVPTCLTERNVNFYYDDPSFPSATRLAGNVRGNLCPCSSINCV